MKRSRLLALTVVFITIAMLFGHADRAAAHVVYCGGQASDQKLSSSLYGYTAVSQCDDMVESVTVVVWLQTFDWGTSQWYDSPSYPVGSDVQAPGIWAVVNGSASVTPYYGLNCRRIRSRHTFTHGTTGVENHVSSGQCF